MLEEKWTGFADRPSQNPENLLKELFTGFVDRQGQGLENLLKEMLTGFVDRQGQGYGSKNLLKELLTGFVDRQGQDPENLWEWSGVPSLVILFKRKGGHVSGHSELEIPIASTLIETDLKELYVEYNVPKAIVSRIFDKEDRAYSPPEGCITIYEAHLRSGLCLSIPDELREILITLKVPIAQLHTNARVISVHVLYFSSSAFKEVDGGDGEGPIQGQLGSGVYLFGPTGWEWGKVPKVYTETPTETETESLEWLFDLLAKMGDSSGICGKGSAIEIFREGLYPTPSRVVLALSLSEPFTWLESSPEAVIECVTDLSEELPAGEPREAPIVPLVGLAITTSDKSAPKETLGEPRVLVVGEPQSAIEAVGDGEPCGGAVGGVYGGSHF
ncbi:hypothetical protein Nepgr_016235 [Nepenthes gracilis]|uniref:Uncharacterized protein n=1 Tax=Nepenthes gracilis TaxID=150966 RepID=A0AAD3SPE9_NEPGR|nr:hypothetical protein Nepgr_016235 [Nepenthes gracilis]